MIESAVIPVPTAIGPDTGRPYTPLADEAPLPFSIRIDRKRPVADQVYDALKDAIISVRLPPNTAISENRICRHVGVSRTPVRAAIIRLVEEDLIDVYPQQGSFVAPIRLSGIRDFHFSRKALEIAVIRETAKIWTPDLSIRSRALIEEHRLAIKAGDEDAFHRLDESFHEVFSATLGLMGVWQTIRGARVRMDRVHRLGIADGRMPVVVEEHAAIIDALDVGDADLAAARLEYHIDRVLEHLGGLRARHHSYFVD